MKNVAEKKLDVSEKQQVNYAVPLWMRDAQIQYAIQHVQGRIQPHHEVRSAAAAIVGYGPSLNQTWEKIRDFTYIFTCSGSHRFLIDRGIIPTYHVEVDPRAHKVKLLGQPHSDVIYLPASTCHPDYFKHLEGYQVQLWHVFDSHAEGLRVLPHEEWAITGGCDVGLRCMTLAAFLGFRKLHIFGMDGCFGETGRHAAEHPNQGSWAECEYEGKTYRTTPAMLSAAQQVWHELDQLPGVDATLYGEGLIQEMAKKYTRKPTDMPKELVGSVGVCKPELISADYASLNAQLHQENVAYGVGGERHAPTILKLCEVIKTKNVLDYGCGKGRLGKAIPWQIAEYDPAVRGKEESPKPADVVVCTDVLEHVEPEKLLFVLGDLQRCVRQIGYFTIHTGPAKKTLPDGRNTHLIQQDKEWWAERLTQFFEVGKIIQRGVELHCIVGPKRRKQQRVPMSVVPDLQPAGV